MLWRLMSEFGGIELVFSAESLGIGRKDSLVENQSVTNRNSGVVAEYDLGRLNVRPETFMAVIHKKEGPIQRLVFLRGEECDLHYLTEKNLPDYCTWAILNAKRGVLYLKWNRKQKPKKTLVRATYWAGG